MSARDGELGDVRIRVSRLGDRVMHDHKLYSPKLHMDHLEPPPSGEPTMLNASFDRVLLLATLPDLETPHFLGPAIANAARCARERLVIVLYSRSFNSRRVPPQQFSPSSKHEHRSSIHSIDMDISHVALWDEVQRILTYAYVQATAIAQELDRMLFEVDVLLKGLDEELPTGLSEGMEITFRIEGDCIPAPIPASVTSLRTKWCPRSLESRAVTPVSNQVASAEPSSYRVVALGGTFDHLHAGHKILLGMAAWIADEKIIVGVTDDALLKTKKHREYLEDITTRIRRTREFLELVKPGIEYYIVPLHDVYGPTGEDPDVQALVVSHETISGGQAIDEIRRERSLPPLRTFIIDVISHSDSRLDPADVEALKHTKMSSTFIREWIARNQTRHKTD
ncbi:Nucleotidylyl transferase [Vararia minispora EC-137]|uniref:Nucleotidylyl transferase n=1 Tax=Vararia minispora EC-137 TaxID=1314806 RepID=A0ACB8QKA0_9AGAM|nr:Nucleotidylyl transferase [Vararia minispora EC-137]